MFARSIFIVTLLFSIGIRAETLSTTGSVTDVYYYGAGMMLVMGFDFGTVHCTGSNGGFLVDSNNPNIDKILSIVLMAKATQREIFVTVEVPPSSCWAPTFGTNNYLILK